MKASELRLGNFVEYWIAEDGIDWTLNIVDVEDLKWCALYESDFNKHHRPIPITEEWLERFGFKSEQPYRFTKGHNDYSYCLESRGRAGFKDGGYFMGIRYDDWPQDPYTIQRFTYNVKYAHELQNIWHSLTSEELTLKEKLK